MPAPAFDALSPMLLGEVKKAFSNPAWAYELKFDGYRLMAEVAGGKVRLKSRNGTDATKWFPEVVAGLATMTGGRHVFDGEVSVLDDIGRSDFERLHARAKMRGYKLGADPVVFCAFDVLVAGGRDLTKQPLAKRKARLEALLASPPPSTLHVSHVVGAGQWLYSQAAELKLEGIVAKRLDSPYLPGVRSDTWLKIKRPGAVPAQRFQR